MVHCRHGDEILAADVSHLMSSESGGAGISGALIRALASQRGIFTGAQVTAARAPVPVTLWQAAASQSTQAFLLVGTLVLLPVILMYSGWSYWVFRGKVRADVGYH